ncbi:MAG TPA: hypothetical protein VN673_00140 [Clostridia bacterium]|nr:hypothetical protein [Clostridia bacterium]
MSRTIPLLLCLLFTCSCQAPGRKHVAALVEQLVSPIGPPGPDITDYNGGQADEKKLEASLKALFEGYEHPQVAQARAKLVAMGTPIFPELVRHLQDQRYCYSFCYAQWVNHSVGETIEHMMAEVVRGQFEPYGYKWRKNGHGSNGQPSFDQMLQEIGAEKYAEHVKGMTQRSAEKEYVEWYLQQEKKYGFTSSEQEEQIVAPCLNRLSQL